MATMTIRTSVAFDPATTARWERLSKRWGVSKSETLRRALESADQPAEPPAAPITGSLTVEQARSMTREESLAWLERYPLITPAQGIQWRKELQETREDFANRP